MNLVFNFIIFFVLPILFMLEETWTEWLIAHCLSQRLTANWSFFPLSIFISQILTLQLCEIAGKYSIAYHGEDFL